MDADVDSLSDEMNALIHEMSCITILNIYFDTTKRHIEVKFLRNLIRLGVYTFKDHD